VNDTRDRDAAVRRLLRQAVRRPLDAGAPGACVDAETIAAWVDGGLPGTEREVVEAHVADCALCQALVGAMARSEPAVRPARSARAARLWLGWLLPLAAAAAAVAFWIAVPRPDRSRSAQPTETRAQVADAKTSEKELSPPAPRDEAKHAEVNPAQPAARSGRQNTKDTAGALVSGAKVDTPPVSSAQAAASENATRRFEATARPADAAAREIEIVSPDPAARWRVRGATVQRSTDGGSTWVTVPTGVASELTAGSSPSPSICWLVGRAGAVLLSIDGRTWRRLAFPEQTDLSAVQARDARIATVTTADGREFRTSDGGLTWIHPPLQEF
jgi:hypothetical protein